MIEPNSEPYNKKIYWLGSKLSLYFIAIACIGFSVLLLPIFFKSYNFQNIGVLGDAVGGFLNPIIGIVAALLTFLAFYVQYQANEQVKKQIQTQYTTEHFYKMLDIHIKNVESFQINSYRYESQFNDLFYLYGDFDTNFDSLKLGDVTKQILKSKRKTKFKRTNDQSGNSKIITKKVAGRRCFMLMVKDLHFTLYCINKANANFRTNKLTKVNVNDLAYKVFFWGANSNYVRLNTMDEKQLKTAKEITKRINAIRTSLSENKGAKVRFKYLTENASVKQSFRFVPFSGHSSRLAHYYRHLYQTVKQLHNSFSKGFISKETLELNLNTLRAQLSNEEQLLLYYNFRIGFGGRWDYREDWKKENRSDYQFLTAYKMIHNIPLHGTICNLVEHPYRAFSKFISENPDFDLFEW